MVCCKNSGEGLETISEMRVFQRATAAVGGTHALMAAVETWIRETPEGRDWLEQMAAEVGVPVQLTLPFPEAQ